MTEWHEYQCSKCGRQTSARRGVRYKAPCPECNDYRTYVRL